MEEKMARERDLAGDPLEKSLIIHVLRCHDMKKFEQGGATNAWYVINHTPDGPKISPIFQHIEQHNKDAALRWTNCAVVDSSIYVIGGLDFASDTLCSSVRYIDTRCPHEGWKTCRHSRYKRQHVITEVVGSNIYVIGGVPYGDGNPSGLWGYIFDTVLQRRISLPSPVEKWFIPAACAVLDGGSDGSGPRGLVVYWKPLKSLFLHDLETNSWELYDDKFGRSLKGPYVVSNRILYIYNLQDRRLHCYDLVNRSWLPEINNLEKDGAVPPPNYMGDIPPFCLLSIADGTLCALWEKCSYDARHRPIYYSRFLVSHNTSGVSHAHVKDKIVFDVDAVEMLNCVALDPSPEIAKQVSDEINQEQQ